MKVGAGEGEGAGEGAGAGEGEGASRLRTGPCLSENILNHTRMLPPWKRSLNRSVGQIKLFHLPRYKHIIHLRQ